MKQGPSIAFRFTVYPIVAAFFVLICAFVIYSAAGYNFKFKDGRLLTEKTGVLIVATRPGEATVSLDGEVQSKKTPNLPIFNLKIKRVISGSHRLKVSKDGYETWEGDVEVSPGLVSWRNYLILVPLERKSQPYNFAGTIKSTVASRDHRRLLALTMDVNNNIYNIWQVNTDNKASTKIAEGKLLPGENIELLSLSNDYSRYLYRKTDATKKTSHFVGAMREGSQATNIDALFSNQAESYYFSPYNAAELFFVQAGGLYRVNLDNNTESAILVKDIVGIYPQDDQLLAVRKVDDNYGLWNINNNNEASNIIKVLPSDTAYRALYLKGSKSYLVQGQTDKDLLLYSTESKNPTLETISHNAALFVPSANGTSIAIYSENKLRVFNLSERKYYDVLESDNLIALDWIQDDRNLVYRTDKEIRTVNFNGDYNKNIFDVSSHSWLLSSYNNHNFFFTDQVETDNDLYVFSL